MPHLKYYFMKIRDFYNFFYGCADIFIDSVETTKNKIDIDLAELSEKENDLF